LEGVEKWTVEGIIVLHGDDFVVSMKRKENVYPAWGLKS